MKDVILTGIKPTGTPHIGNYLGAIKPAIEMSKNQDNDQFYFIADYHALTTVDSADKLKDYTYQVAATWLACGLDPEKVVFYKQSDIPETFELTTILTNLTPKGLMNRAHAYKAKVQANEQEGIDKDSGVNMGLFNYPILMAADILLFNTKKVPVGQDQKQHIEIARDIANSFNKRFGYSLVVPKPDIKEDVKTVEGTDGRKMSKSYGNIIPLFADSKQLEKIVKKIKTDSTLPNEPKDLNSTVFILYKQFATPEQTLAMQKRFEEGLGWGEAKKALFEVIENAIAPMREKYNYYMQNPALIDEILLNGAKKARPIAKETIARIRKAIGV